MITLTLALLGGILAVAVLDDGSGFALGAALGFVGGKLREAQQRVASLARAQHELLLELRAFRLEAEQRFRELARPLSTGAAAGVEEAQAKADAEPAEEPPLAASAVPFEPAPPAPFEPAPAPPAARAAPVEPAPPAPFEPAPAPPTAPPYVDPVEVFFARLRGLLFGGNTIVRAGVLVLLVGVALLLRWAAEHSVFPIELRLCLVVLIAMALVGVGYRQRAARPGFGQSLQGAGVAALYLVVFFAFRRYQLLPAQLAFALLAAIALASGLLALLQDARALVVIGQIGGFMAPVLASSGEGSHVALFSYYLLLNLLVFAVAWLRPWRALNLIGFAFTFGVGSTWGALRYRPELFASTEPFLIAFFLLYSTIPVLYALRGDVAQRGWVDASLVFGTPLAALILQYALVEDVPFGMAYSALALAAYYVTGARLMDRYAPERLRALREASLAVGIGFATLAVPYGLDNHDFTGATWALEGAGLYWVGMRQQRWLSRAAGALLQLLAAGALLYRHGEGSRVHELPLVNAPFLASVLVCLGCLFVAALAHRARRALPAFEASLLQALIGLGLAFLWGALLHECDRHVPEALKPGTPLALFAASLLALDALGRRLDWLPSRFPGAGFVLLLVPIALTWEIQLGLHPLGRGGAFAIPLCFALCYVVLRYFAEQVSFARAALHCAALWFFATFLACEAFHLVRDFAQLGPSWSASALGCALGLVLPLVVRGSARGGFPFAAAPFTYGVVGAGGVAAVLGLWTLSISTSAPGDAAPLSFVPLLNPLDLAQTVLLIAIAGWCSALPAQGETARALAQLVRPLLAALAFLALNAALARSVHQLAQVPFALEPLWASSALQVTLSISWSLLGLAGTVLGSRRGLRALWIAAALLLALVVLKLFTVDLAQLATIAKIGTFLAVGFLLVLVGYFAPVPPAAAARATEAKT